MPAQAEWTFSGEPVSLEQPGGLVTIVEGSSFCLSGRAGDIRPGGADGLFVLDTRVVSGWRLSLDARPLEPLSVSITEPYAATFVSRLAPEAGQESTLLVVRRRWVGSGMREDIELHNYSDVPLAHAVQLRVESDFADLFAVKAGRADPAADVMLHETALDASAVRSGVRRDVHMTQRCGAPGLADGKGLSWDVVVPARGVWSVCLEVTMAVDGQDVELQHCCGELPTASRPSKRLAGLRREAPQLHLGDPRLAAALERAVDDVGSLIIEDPRHPGSPVVAAGAPWFMALFGRDSLLTSYMSLLVDPSLAVGVLQTLARLQGASENAATEEQPGRILHEVRFSSNAAVDLDDGHIYYGTADATPLFVMMVGELSRWGGSRSVIDALLPHVDRAIEWIETFGDPDGDGYVEYERLTPDGLANQGWKDSWDGINSADGTLARAPVALAEVQGYVYAGYLARAELADQRADLPTATRCRAKAERLKAAFNRDFWIDARGWYALALDADKRHVDALASNVGHCLWTGIVDESRAGAVAERLLSPEMSSGWGLRTLSTQMARYNPLSYHNGSVWPHDTAIAAAGLMRYGFVDESRRLIEGLLDASCANAGRLPELYAGLDRSELPVPVAYPTSCSPQAWSSAAPLLLLRTLLRLDPRLDQGVVRIDPVAEGAFADDVSLSLGGGRVRIRRGAGALEVSGLPRGVELAP
ncbi:MAG: hypothetical protein QOE64_2662 [Frankiales bacterium]|nr:hypothetical protein [Frankiales bacterium]